MATIDIKQIKAKLHEKILLAKKSKQDKSSKNEDKCDHEWQRYKETIVPARSDENIKAGSVYTKGQAYFITMGCAKCHKKRRISMKVEEH